MMSRLLLVLVYMAGVIWAQDPPARDAQDQRSQARTAVAEKRFGKALTLYRTLLTANPGDVDYMLWIARLSAWSGDRAAAVNFYDQALVLDPPNVDALTGKANVLLWRHAYPEAFVLLTKASEIAPSNAEVELAWARYYHWQADDKQARIHLANCLAADGANQEALELREGLVPDHTIEVRLAFEGDTLSGTTPGAIEQFGATYLYRNGDVGIDFFHDNRFGEAGSRGGVHLSRKLGGHTTVRAAALFGGGGNIVPRQDLSAGMSHALRHGWVLGADYRHIAFRTLKVDAAIANADYYFEKPVWILTSFAANRVEGATTPAFLGRFNVRVRKNLTLQAGYGYGTEVFQLALPTDFGSFRRDSYIGGLTLALTRKTRAEATYTLARRSTGIFENMYLFALVHAL